jgi:plastocyanin
MLKFVLALCLSLASCFVQCKEISIKVVTQLNKAIPNFVVALIPKTTSPTSQSDNVVIMDQIDTQFSPHILVIQKNSKVLFPNSDSIKHHVYSFSSAKTFELQLYKELKTQPLLFSESGVVELGCNVHDWMLGYVYVVETPFFAKTNIEGNVVIDVPDGEYQLTVWHPRIQDELSALTRDLSIPIQSAITVRLQKPLLVDLNQYEQESGEFSDY